LQSIQENLTRESAKGSKVNFNCIRLNCLTNLFIPGLSGDCVTLPTGQMTIPPGHVWIEGDNASVSMDSRDFGPLPMGLLVGKVYATLFPYKKVMNRS
jgi:hypothetical protein